MGLGCPWGAKEGRVPPGEGNDRTFKETGGALVLRLGCPWGAKEGRVPPGAAGPLRLGGPWGALGVPHYYVFEQPVFCCSYG